MGSLGGSWHHISNKPRENAYLDILVKKLREKVEAINFPGPIFPRTDDAFLARFIRVKSYDLDKAFKTIKKYYECIYKHREYHKDIRPSHFAYAYESKAYHCLKHRFDDVCVGVFRIRFWEPKDLPLIDCQKAAVFVAEEYLNQIQIQEKGVSFIFDFEGLRFEHLWNATIKEIRRCAEVTLEALPMRIVSIHVLHPPKIFWPVYHIGKRFVKQKILNRVHFHADCESLHKFFNKEMLPDFLGGDLREEEGTETDVIKKILKEDIPYEDYWNGTIWRTKSNSG